MKRFIGIGCILSIILASPAFAYKRDVPSKVETEETKESEPQQTTQEEYEYSSGGGGLVTAGYVCIALGSAAAIAGTTIITATDKRLTGAIVDAGGAALALAGTLMLVFGERAGYALTPTVDPVHNTYGLAFAKNF